MALSTARIHRVRGRPPFLAAGIKSLIHSHSSSVKSLGYVFSFISPFYTTHEDFSDRLLELLKSLPAIPEHTQQELALQLALGPSLRMIKGHTAPEVAGVYTRVHALSQQVGESRQR